MPSPGRDRLVATVVLVALPTSLLAQAHLRDEDLHVLLGSTLESDFRRMLPDYLLRGAKQATAKRLLRFEGIKSEGDFKKWQEGNRARFLESIGGLPSQRAPLNPRVVGDFAREGYVVRRIIFESLPEFYVTANLYLPTTGKPPYPAVLSPVGHSKNGKAYDIYQHLFIGLVKRGYAVLTWDPQGQGERLQYWDAINHRRSFEFNQHAMAGLQEYLLGQNLARYFIWDGIRALDYLTSLREVDSSRIGCTGNSGGGTLTTYISMLDPRVKVSSIVTFITSIPDKIEARALDAESDPEQDIAGLLAAEIDHTEMVGMIAPRPVLIGAAIRDFFPIEGTRATVAQLQWLYKMLGVRERLNMVEFDHRHMYSQPLREVTYAWFDRWLKGQEAEAREPPITIENDETLQCTPTGQVLTSLGGKRMIDFNRELANRLLQTLQSRRRDPAFSRELPERIRERLALPRTPVDPRPRSLGASEAAGLAIEKLLIESEPGIVVPIRVIRSGREAGRRASIVYLRDRLGDKDSPAIFESLARNGRLVAVADVRGFGETWALGTVKGATERYFDPRDGPDADFTYASFFLPRPLLGMRVWDALNVVQYLRSRLDVDPARIAIAGRGWAALVVLFAAATDPKISAVALEAIPASYGQVARAELYDLPASSILPGVLRDFDLPDVLRSLGSRACLVLSPTDALARKMTRADAEATFQDVWNAQRPPAFVMRVAPLDSEALQELTRWLLDY